MKEQIIYETIFYDKASKAMKKQIQTVRNIGRGMERVKTVTTKLTKGQNEITAATVKTQEATSKFKMEYLGVMFAGMAMKRVTDRVLGGLWKTFKQITDGGAHPLRLAITKLSATWQMFKFELFDTLGTMIERYFPKIIEGLNWIRDNPWAKKVIAIAIVATAILGTLLMVIGQIGLGFWALAGLFTGGGILIVAAVALIIVIIVAFIDLIRRLIPVAKAVHAGVASAFNKIKSVIVSVFSFIKNKIWKPIAGFFKKWVINPLVNAWKAMVNRLKAGWNWIKNIARKIGEKIGIIKPKRSRQFGGYIPETGMYLMHRGETVSNPTFNTNVNITAPQISSTIDLDILARRVGSQIMRGASRYSSMATRY